MLSVDGVVNSTKSKKERVGRMVQMHLKLVKMKIKEVRAGDIGLKDITTGDTICDLKNQIVLKGWTFLNP